jgi:hypothetical protein
MTEWILFVWFTGCSWNCNAPPTFPPFKTKEECEIALEEWLDKPSGGSWTPFGWDGRRGGECIERPVK